MKNTDTPKTDRYEGSWATEWHDGLSIFEHARQMERDLNEALAIAKGAMHAVEMIYGHAQHCNECRSFEIANDCRNEMHGIDRVISLQNAVAQTREKGKANE